MNIKYNLNRFYLVINYNFNDKNKIIFCFFNFFPLALFKFSPVYLLTCLLGFV